MVMMFLSLINFVLNHDGVGDLYVGNKDVCDNDDGNKGNEDD